jgi:hypothetical protein
MPDVRLAHNMPVSIPTKANEPSSAANTHWGQTLSMIHAGKKDFSIFAQPKEPNKSPEPRWPSGRF